MQNTIHGLRFTHFVEYEPIKKRKVLKNTSLYWHRLITHGVQTSRILRTCKTINVPAHLSDTEATRVLALYVIIY